jgi:arsenite methyltransferase
MTNPSKTDAGDQLPADTEAIVDRVREKYGQIAARVDSGCCGPKPASGCCSNETQPASSTGYSPEELAVLPDGADLGLGCGAPVRHLDLRPGETVLDLGSGAGIDVLLAALKVGPGGRAIGVDMTPEMVERAKHNAEKSGMGNAEFRLGRLESLPVEDASVDAVTSNCVINLVPDKSLVFREAARVLRPGGRLVISDIVLDGELPEAIRTDVLAYVGCVAGALQRETYFDIVTAAGFSSVEVLRDVDSLAIVCDTSPRQVKVFTERTGVDLEELRGRVRSVTYRAVK